MLKIANLLKLHVFVSYNGISHLLLIIICLQVIVTHQVMMMMMMASQ